MINLAAILKATPSIVRNRAKQQCKSMPKKVSGVAVVASKQPSKEINAGGGVLIDNGLEGQYWEYQRFIKCKKDLRRTIVRFHGPVEVGTKIWCSCDCEFFLYYCEYALAKRGSSSIIYCNGEPPKNTNPTQKPMTCKHVLHLCGLAIAKREASKKIIDATTNPTPAVPKKQNPVYSWLGGDNTTSMRERKFVKPE